MYNDTSKEPIKAQFNHKEVVSAMLLLCPISINKDLIGTMSEDAVFTLAFDFIKEVASAIVHHLQSEEAHSTITKLIKRSRSVRDSGAG